MEVSDRTYILITPAKDEEEYIEKTILSVTDQSIRPIEWVIVSDGSTDRTEEIIRGYAEKYDFIRLLRLTNRPDRSFVSRVFATESGCSAIQSIAYDFIGFLDADIEIETDYFQFLISKFEMLPELGLAGGELVDIVDGREYRYRVSEESVSGAIHFYRLKCFESLGGMVAIPEGGWDTIAEVTARMNNWRTRSFSEKEVHHLRPLNAAQGNRFRRKWQMGRRDYFLGNHPLFEIFKCSYRIFERPFFVSTICRLLGYFDPWIRRSKINLPARVVEYRQNEQIERLSSLFRVSSGQDNS